MDAKPTRERKPVDPATVNSRIARYRDLKFTKRGHLDTFIPGYDREVVAVIGPGVLEDPSHRPAIDATDGFNVTYVKCKPGEGNALHDHETAEVFIPMAGRWHMTYGDNGEFEATLGPYDLISFPAGVMRSFKNVSDVEALLLVIVGGNDPGRIYWPASLLEMAAKHGAVLDAQGQVKKSGHT